MMIRRRNKKRERDATFPVVISNVNIPSLAADRAALSSSPPNSLGSSKIQSPQVFSRLLPA